VNLLICKPKLTFSRSTKYFEQSAKLTKITVYLSTDELSLPYAPTNQWRPLVIVKEAFRSLISTSVVLAHSLFG